MNKSLVDKYIKQNNKRFTYLKNINTDNNFEKNRKTNQHMAISNIPKINDLELKKEIINKIIKKIEENPTQALAHKDEINEIIAKTLD